MAKNNVVSLDKKREEKQQQQTVLTVQQLSDKIDFACEEVEDVASMLLGNISFFIMENIGSFEEIIEYGHTQPAGFEAQMAALIERIRSLMYYVYGFIIEDHLIVQEIYENRIEIDKLNERQLELFN